MNGFLKYQFWLWVVAGLFALRQFLVIWAAEQGRKHDLVKKLYKQQQAFHISVLVPFLNTDDFSSLLMLLQALYEQDYPNSKVTIHVVTHEEGKQHLIPQSVRNNVKIWQAPDVLSRYEQVMPWLIERCLAAGGNGMFVFLKSTDIVKPDFFQNIVARGLDSFAIQGYVALKNPPTTMLEKTLSLSARLFNRIGNAGHYHMGLSCRLLDSGWAIKQEVLEMIPFRRGMDMDNLEYSIRLNLENFRVNWAPNVVVYSDSRVSFLCHLTRCVGSFFNRLNLLLFYGPRLLTRMIVRFDLNYLEQILAIVKPPFMVATLLLFGFALYSQMHKPPVGDPLLWSVAGMAALVFSLMGLWVARCKPADYITMLIFTPLIYVAEVVALPVALFNYLHNRESVRPPKGSTYRISKKTRFNEEMDAPPNLFDESHSANVIQNILKKNAPQHSHELDELMPRTEKRPRRQPPPLIDSGYEPVNSKLAPLPEEVLPTPVERAKLPRETIKSVPLSNGSKEIPCSLKTRTTFDEEGSEQYQLTLEYKSLSVTTEVYRILDQAFYELHAKLMSRGLTIITCGSCGNFYNPTADVPGALRNAGVCLFGKMGQEVNLHTDAVTVMSQACGHHCDLSQREHLVRQWKESLALSRVH